MHCRRCLGPRAPKHFPEWAVSRVSQASHQQQPAAARLPIPPRPLAEADVMPSHASTSPTRGGCGDEGPRGGQTVTHVTSVTPAAASSSTNPPPFTPPSRGGGGDEGRVGCVTRITTLPLRPQAEGAVVTKGQGGQPARASQGSMPAPWHALQRHGLFLLDLHGLSQTLFSCCFLPFCPLRGCYAFLAGHVMLC